MANPSTLGEPQSRRSSLSALQLAKQKDVSGHGVNFCPFGEEGHVDEKGYCDHLVGFTTDGKTYEPMVKDARGYWQVKGGDPQPVLRTDKLVQITVSSRVYRDTPPKK